MRNILKSEQKLLQLEAAFAQDYPTATMKVDKIEGGYLFASIEGNPFESRKEEVVKIGAGDQGLAMAKYKAFELLLSKSGATVHLIGKGRTSAMAEIANAHAQSIPLAPMKKPIITRARDKKKGSANPITLEPLTIDNPQKHYNGLTREMVVKERHLATLKFTMRQHGLEEHLDTLRRRYRSITKAAILTYLWPAGSMAENQEIIDMAGGLSDNPIPPTQEETIAASKAMQPTEGPSYEGMSFEQLIECPPPPMEVPSFGDEMMNRFHKLTGKHSMDDEEFVARMGTEVEQYYPNMSDFVANCPGDYIDAIIAALDKQKS